MYHGHDISAVYVNGVLRPDAPLSLPENARVHVAIRRVEVTPDQEQRGRLLMQQLRQRGAIRLGGWRPTRTELHERG